MKKQTIKRKEKENMINHQYYYYHGYVHPTYNILYIIYSNDDYYGLNMHNDKLNLLKCVSRKDNVDTVEF